MKAETVQDTDVQSWMWYHSAFQAPHYKQGYLKIMSPHHTLNSSGILSYLDVHVNV